MQIKLGEKIKELRKRDGRKQEDLAIALGVTNQAVSRWEANGGYPDMEMIPAIANYFHITIDELFGYDNDREIKLKSYLDQADEMLGKSEDITPCVELLRNALSEFPSEWRLQYRLADSLITMGCQRICGRTAEGCDYTQKDIAYNVQNEYRKEAISLYEEVLKKEIDNAYRISATISLVTLYYTMGDFENAERTALSQSPVRISKEVLLASAADGEKGDRYQGEAILSLMHELSHVIQNSVMSKASLSHSQAGLDKLLAVIRLYESIVDDGNYGKFHSDLCMLYLRCSAVAICLNDSELALKYFEIAWDHFTKFKQERKNFQFTAPLVSKVKDTEIGVVLLNRDIFELYLKALPTEFADTIRTNPKYSSIFAQ
ncbi:MAG: helix-turn-helix transcriptional regulator [Eubacteriales bacterium]